MTQNKSLKYEAFVKQYLHAIQDISVSLLFLVTVDFEAACELFKEVQKRDPYSLEHMDTYSNILYVKVRSHLFIMNLFRWSVCYSGSNFSLVEQ